MPRFKDMKKTKTMTRTRTRTRTKRWGGFRLPSMSRFKRYEKDKDKDKEMGRIQTAINAQV